MMGSHWNKAGISTQKSAFTKRPYNQMLTAPRSLWETDDLIPAKNIIQQQQEIVPFTKVTHVHSFTVACSIYTAVGKTASIGKKITKISRKMK